MALPKNFKRRKFTVAFKLKIVNELRKIKNVSKLATKYNLDRKQIRSWKKNKSRLSEIKKKQTKARVSRTSTVLIELENELIRKINELRSQDKIVSDRFIRIEALRIANEKNLNFRASNGWLSNFVDRKQNII